MDFNIVLHSDRPVLRYQVQQYNPDGFPSFSGSEERDSYNLEQLVELLADLKLSE